MSAQHEAGNRTTSFMYRHARWIIGLSLLLTAALSVPFLTMEPTENASQEPVGAVFDARDEVNEKFVTSVFPTTFVVVARDGNMLAKPVLMELLKNSRKLRRQKKFRKTLLQYFEPQEGVDIVGVRSIADQIDDALVPSGGLAKASERQINQVAIGLIDKVGLQKLGLSQKTTVDHDAGVVVAPALVVTVLSDDTVLGFGNVAIALGGNTDNEEYSRDIEAVLRGSEKNYELWGIAIDVNLTSSEQGETAGPFIGFTILAVLVIVGLTFRSYWVLAITGAALAALIIWLQGIANLVGLKEDLILSLIVPIAMISFGVDFAFHAVGRYRENRVAGLAPRAAFTIGIAAVVGALVLALASDSVAFLANVSSGIPSIIQFGIGAAVALSAAFLLLGIVTPLAVMKVEERVGEPSRTRRAAVFAVFGSLVAGSFTMISVLLSVFVFPAGGLIVLGIYLVLMIAIPYSLASRTHAPAVLPDSRGTTRQSPIIGNALVGIAKNRWIFLPLFLLLTILAGYFALQVPAEFDVKDFFAEETDFVVALDKIDQYFGEEGGEPSSVYIEAELTNPDNLAAIAKFTDRVAELDTERFTQTKDNKVRVGRGVLDSLNDVFANPAAIAAVAQKTGVELTDADANKIPDTKKQLAAVFTTTRQIGVPIDARRLAATPDDVRTVLWVSDDGSQQATVLTLEIRGSRAVENVNAARNEIEPLIDDLEAELQKQDSGAVVQFTGSPIVRQESLDAVSRALQVSLPIAVLLCLAIVWLFMRSLKYAIVSIIPILIVVSWLYGFMYLGGFSINLVTATIGAVSIGIGIDYSIHFTMRYRDELAERGDRLEAIRATGQGTGVALMASAISSAVGFGILALAPMPLFASYGFLTAVMIMLALATSLMVLPPLLMLATRDA